MKVNPRIYHRRSIRLKGYDYSQSGTYFVTICAKDRELYFEKYRGLQEIVRQQWEELPQRFPDLTLDEFIIMANHIHGILIVGAGLAPALSYRATARVAPTFSVDRPAPTVGEIVGTFKSLCIHDWLTYIKEKKIDAIWKFWQRNYYEHVIRNEDELNRIREYIQNNPLKWHLDKENPEGIGADPLEEEMFKYHVFSRSTGRS
jgi:REP element-mobilizing transposase RayT